MSEVTQAVCFDRGPSGGPLIVEQLTDPDQISLEVARGAMQVLANSYASSPGIRKIVPAWAIYDHFVPVDAEGKIRDERIADRQAAMRQNITINRQDYWLAREQDGRLTGLAKSSPSNSTRTQHLRKMLGRPKPDLFVPELVEIPDANGAQLGLLYAMITSGGYSGDRNLEMNVYKTDRDQQRLVSRYLGMQIDAAGNSYEIMTKTLESDRFAGRWRKLSHIQAILEEKTGWLTTMHAIER